MGSAASRIPLNVTPIPDEIEELHWEKQEIDLQKKVTVFLLAESDLPFNSLSSENIELLLRCQTSNDVGDILNMVDGFYDPYFETTLRLIIFINTERSLVPHIG